jgi:hypothetical protein
VIQARDDRASYYFEQRWLYQDIGDFPRPQLEHIDYRNAGELKEKLETVLTAHNVSTPNRAEILEQFARLTQGETGRLLLAGLPYFGSRAEFATTGKWTGALLTAETRTPATAAFNEFCARGHALTQVQHLEPVIDDLARRLNFGQLTASASLREFLWNLFISTQNAVREVYGYDQSNYHPGNRIKPENHSTSWLKYITFEFRPSVPEPVCTFLEECVNRSEIHARIEADEKMALLLRVPLPLAGYEAFALSAAQHDSFSSFRNALVAALRTTPGLQQLASAAAFLALQDAADIPHRLYAWMDMFSRNDFMTANSFLLTLTSTNNRVTPNL